MNELLACGGYTEPMIYLGSVVLIYLLALSIARYLNVVKGHVDIGLTAIGVLMIEWWVYNLLQSSCQWEPWSNIVAESLIAWFIFRRWRKSGKPELLGILQMLSIYRIFLAAMWGLLDFEYEWNLNASFIVMTMATTIGLCILPQKGDKVVPAQ